MKIKVDEALLDAFGYDVLEGKILLSADLPGFTSLVSFKLGPSEARRIGTMLLRAAEQAEKQLAESAG